MLWYFWRIVMQLNNIALYRCGVWYKWAGHNNRNTLACIMRRIMDLLNIITLIKVWFIAVMSNETAFYLDYELAIKCRHKYFMIIRKQAADSWWIIFGCSSDILQGFLLNVNTSLTVRRTRVCVRVRRERVWWSCSLLQESDTSPRLVPATEINI